MAGISLNWLKDNLGDNNRYFRCMPTLAAQEGLGSFAISYTPNVSEYEINEITNFFESCGVVEFIDESLMTKVVALNGSAPGYFYYIARIVADEAERMGFDRQTAINLFAQTMKGSAETILNSDLTLQELEDKIKVHGGTTFAALTKMHEVGLESCVVEGLRACVARNEELGKM